MPKNYKSVVIILVMGIMFFTYYVLTTKSEYVLTPEGDSKTYTLMTLHFGTPENVKDEMPAMYTRRIFPAFVAHLFMYPYKLRNRSAVNAVSTYKDMVRIGFIDINRQVFSAWLLSNLVAYLLQLFFLYKLLSRLKIDEKIIFCMLAIYSTWFLSVRLYVNWVQMPDPWAFAFLSAASYFMVTYNRAGFFISVLLGSLCKEMLLFIVPSFLWLNFLRERPRDFILKSLPLAALPFLLFIFMRAYPYFPSKISAPNMPSLVHHAIVSHGTWLSDYLEILYYHTIYRMQGGTGYYLDTLFIPIGAFAGISFFLIRHCTKALRILRENAYWIPYLFFISLIGLNVDRYIFYLFPLIIILSAKILETNYEGKRLYFMMALLFVLTAWSQDFFKMPWFAAQLELTHQLEVGEVLAPGYAARFRTVLVETALVALVGFIIAARIGAAKKEV